MYVEIVSPKVNNFRGYFLRDDEGLLLVRHPVIQFARHRGFSIRVLMGGNNLGNILFQYMIRMLNTYRGVYTLFINSIAHQAP